MWTRSQRRSSRQNISHEMQKPLDRRSALAAPNGGSFSILDCSRCHSLLVFVPPCPIQFPSYSLPSRRARDARTVVRLSAQPCRLDDAVHLRDHPRLPLDHLLQAYRARQLEPVRDEHAIGPAATPMCPSAWRRSSSTTHWCREPRLASRGWPFTIIMPNAPIDPAFSTPNAG
jgi:hypothetical protein